MFGVWLALIFALEACYRGQSAIRQGIHSVFGEPGLATPNSDSTWYNDYMTEEKASGRLRWEPFLHWHRVRFDGEFVNVDEIGRRRTVHLSAVGGAAKRAYFFGGSTMYGTGQRDGMTIPSCVAAHGPAGGSITQLKVTNFGEIGYVFTQEVIQLLLELRNGGRPDVVVFYDGINDVMAAIQNGKAGIPQNESNRVTEFELGRSVFNWRKDVVADIRAWGDLTKVGFKRLQFPQRIVAFVSNRAPSPAPPVQDLANELVSSYAATVGIVEALSRAYGFRVLYIWQPTLPGSIKPLTPFESHLAEGMKGVGFQETRIALHRTLPAKLDSAMKPLVGQRFVNLSGLFAADPSPVYLDETGHTTEYAVPIIVRAFWEQLADMLGEGKTPFSPRPGFCDVH